MSPLNIRVWCGVVVHVHSYILAFIYLVHFSLTGYSYYLWCSRVGSCHDCLSLHKPILFLFLPFCVVCNVCVLEMDAALFIR